MIQKFGDICGGTCLSFGTETSGEGRNVSTWAYNTFVRAKFTTVEDWKVCYSALCYLFGAMHPDVAAVRAGIVLVAFF
jgi:hypothetical protein